MKKPVRREKPFPVVGVVVAAGCMLAVIAVYFLAKPLKGARTAAVKKSRRKKKRGRVIGTRITASGKTIIVREEQSDAPLPASAPAARAEPRRAASSPMVVRLSADTRGRKATEWKLVAGCPKCGKEVTPWMAQACACGQALRWPAEISCPFCGGAGKCSSCKGEETVCKYCKGRARRAMMGIQIEQCGYCEGSGKCMICKGSGKCPKCEGTGKIVPSKMKP